MVACNIYLHAHIEALDIEVDGRYQAVRMTHKVLSLFQAYLIAVTCKDNSRYVIYRRYSDFHEMHSHLEERFPIEAGAISAKDRTLPTLPGVSLSPPLNGSTRPCPPYQVCACLPPLNGSTRPCPPYQVCPSLPHSMVALDLAHPTRCVPLSPTQWCTNSVVALAAVKDLANEIYMISRLLPVVHTFNLVRATVSIISSHSKQKTVNKYPHLLTTLKFYVSHFLEEQRA